MVGLTPNYKFFGLLLCIFILHFSFHPVSVSSLTCPCHDLQPTLAVFGMGMTCSSGWQNLVFFSGTSEWESLADEQ